MEKKTSGFNVFVSQPHKDRAWDDMERTSAELMEKVREDHPEAEEVKMLKPYQFNGQHPVYYLAFNLQMMCQADLVVFAPDWWTSKACCIEHDICELYGIPYKEGTFL